MPKKQSIYRVVFLNRGKVYELHAKEVSQSGLYGFVEVGDFEFRDETSVVIDPSEDRLRAEFESVTSTFIPMHTILRIDQVERTGVNKISSLSDDDKIAHFPAPVYTPGTIKD